MKNPASAPEAEPRNYAAIVLGALLVVGVVAIIVALVIRREPDYALVLATPQDCLRAYDETKCHEIVARALAVHASSAPRFADQSLCELNFGQCTPVTLLNGAFFAPSIAAIVVARGEIDNPKGMAPLYFGARDADAAEGRRVFYHGLAVGILQGKRFGGAAMSILTDLAGRPVTSETVRRLRRS